ncbi:uncharacterized protein LOC131957891 [Physella acuta]|uniref:uncharacterized protein LOC131957891 n=1 Tax=Physella acuta TaxID=109671 RepID=UPI0027DABAAD|nr:uncharacterized protein LOC131957891 [Physella acuta]
MISESSISSDDDDCILETPTKVKVSPSYSRESKLPVYKDKTEESMNHKPADSTPVACNSSTSVARNSSSELYVFDSDASTIPESDPDLDSDDDVTTYKASPQPMEEKCINLVSSDEDEESQSMLQTQPSQSKTKPSQDSMPNKAKKIVEYLKQPAVKEKIGAFFQKAIKMQKEKVCNWDEKHVVKRQVSSNNEASTSFSQLKSPTFSRSSKLSLKKNDSQSGNTSMSQSTGGTHDISDSDIVLLLSDDSQPPTPKKKVFPSFSSTPVPRSASQGLDNTSPVFNSSLSEKQSSRSQSKLNILSPVGDNIVVSDDLNRSIPSLEKQASTQSPREVLGSPPVLSQYPNNEHLPADGITNSQNVESSRTTQESKRTRHASLDSVQTTVKNITTQDSSLFTQNTSNDTEKQGLSIKSNILKCISMLDRSQGTTQQLADAAALNVETNTPNSPTTIINIPQSVPNETTLANEPSPVLSVTVSARTEGQEQVVIKHEPDEGEQDEEFEVNYSVIDNVVHIFDSDDEELYLTQSVVESPHKLKSKHTVDDDEMNSEDELVLTDNEGDEVKTVSSEHTAEEDDYECMTQLDDDELLAHSQVDYVFDTEEDSDKTTDEAQDHCLSSEDSQDKMLVFKEVFEMETQEDPKSRQKNGALGNTSIQEGFQDSSEDSDSSDLENISYSFLTQVDSPKKKKRHKKTSNRKQSEEVDPYLIPTQCSSKEESVRDENKNKITKVGMFRRPNKADESPQVSKKSGKDVADAQVDLDYDNDDDAYDAPTQICKKTGDDEDIDDLYFRPTQMLNKEMDDEDSDMYDAPTQVVQKHSDDADSDAHDADSDLYDAPTQVVQKHDDADSDADSYLYDALTQVVQKPTDDADSDLYDAPTQVMQKHNDDADSDLYDAPTQVMQKHNDDADSDLYDAPTQVAQKHNDDAESDLYDAPTQVAQKHNDDAEVDDLYFIPTQMLEKECDDLYDAPTQIINSSDRDVEAVGADLTQPSENIPCPLDDKTQSDDENDIYNMATQPFFSKDVTDDEESKKAKKKKDVQLKHGNGSVSSPRDKVSRNENEDDIYNMATQPLMAADSDDEPSSEEFKVKHDKKNKVTDVEQSNENIHTQSEDEDDVYNMVTQPFFSTDLKEERINDLKGKHHMKKPGPSSSTEETHSLHDPYSSATQLSAKDLSPDSSDQADQNIKTQSYKNKEVGEHKRKPHSDEHSSHKDVGEHKKKPYSSEHRSHKEVGQHERKPHSGESSTQERDSSTNNSNTFVISNYKGYVSLIPKPFVSLLKDKSSKTVSEKSPNSSEVLATEAKTTQHKSDVHQKVKVKKYKEQVDSKTQESDKKASSKKVKSGSVSESSYPRSVSRKKDKDTSKDVLSTSSRDDPDIKKNHSKTDPDGVVKICSSKHSLADAKIKNLKQPDKQNSHSSSLEHNSKNVFETFTNEELSKTVNRSQSFDETALQNSVKTKTSNQLEKQSLSVDESLLDVGKEGRVSDKGLLNAVVSKAIKRSSGIEYKPCSKKSKIEKDTNEDKLISVTSSASAAPISRKRPHESSRSSNSSPKKQPSTSKLIAPQIDKKAFARHVASVWNKIKQSQPKKSPAKKARKEATKAKAGDKITMGIEAAKQKLFERELLGKKLTAVADIAPKVLFVRSVSREESTDVEMPCTQEIMAHGLPILSAPIPVRRGQTLEKEDNSIINADAISTKNNVNENRKTESKNTPVASPLVEDGAKLSLNMIEPSSSSSTAGSKNSKVETSFPQSVSKLEATEPNRSKIPDTISPSSAVKNPTISSVSTCISSKSVSDKEPVKKAVLFESSKSVSDREPVKKAVLFESSKSVSDREPLKKAVLLENVLPKRTQNAIATPKSILREPNRPSGNTGKNVNFNDASLSSVRFISKETSPFSHIFRNVQKLKDNPQLDVNKIKEWTFRILNWNPDWLKEYEKQLSKNLKEQKPPPLLGDTTYSRLRMYYESVKEYQDITSKLLLLEIWESIYQDWKQKQGRSWSCKVHLDGVPHDPDKNRRSKDGNNFSLLTVKVVAAVSNQERREIPSPGDLLVLDAWGVLKSKPKDNPLTNPQFALVKNVFFLKIADKNRLCETYPLFGKEPVPAMKENNFIVVCLTLDVAFKVNFCNVQLMNIRKIANLKTAQRQLEALAMLPESPLCSQLLCPSNPQVYFNDPIDPEPQLLAKLNSEQANAVATIKDSVLKRNSSEKVFFIQGPAGTGKSYTILVLIHQILVATRFQARICLATPSNAAVDELAKRIINFSNKLKVKKLHSISLVRVGNPNSIHPEVKPYYWETLADLHCKKSSKTVLPTSLQDELSYFKDQAASLQADLKNVHIPRAAKASKKATLKDYETKIRNLESEVTNKQATAREKYEARCNIFDNAHVICGTLNSLGAENLKDFLLRKENKRHKNCPFTCLIIDEATQAIEAECLIPLKYKISKMILVGDHKQLPATVLSQKAAQLELSRSLFERLNLRFEEVQKVQKEEPVISPIMLLVKQYRMHPEILSLPNNLFYDGKLQNDISVQNRKSVLSPYLVFDIHGGKESLRVGGDRSLANVPEAVCTAELCLIVIKALKITKDHVRDRIGVICPYAEQKQTILECLRKRELHQIDVNTVDGFQGQERDVIIMSCVRAQGATASIGFLADKRRMNVSLTRAKYAMYVLGHFETLKTNGLWEELHKDAAERNLLVDVTDVSRFSDIASRKLMYTSSRSS